MEKAELTALIVKAQAGDQGAMEEVLRTAHTSVSYQCRKLLRNPDNAEDMTQEVLLTVYTRLDTLKTPEAFWGWLNQTTANRCINALKRSHVELQFAEDEDGHSVLDNLEELDEQQVPDKALDNAETARMIEEIVNQLPEAQRICVLMYYYDEMGVKEIAAALGVPENTVKSRLNYARKAVKEKVLDYEKKGVKLYGLSPLPFMLYFLLRAAEETADSAAAGAMAKKAVELGAAAAGGTAAGGTAGAGAAVSGKAAAGAAAGGKAAATAGVSAGGKAVGTALSAKFIAGSLATLLAVGSVTAAVVIPQNQAGPEPTPTPAITETLLSESERPPEESVTPEPTETPSVEESIPAERLALLNDVTYYGDVTQCRMTVNQAMAYAEVLEAGDNAPYAALIDLGAGSPVLLLARGVDSGAYIGSTPEASLPGHNRFDGKLEVWQYTDGQAERIASGHEVYWMAGEGFVCQTRVGGTEDESGNPLPMEAQSHYLDFTADAYSVEGGTLSMSPIASALVEIDLMGMNTSEGGTIDGQLVGQAVWPTWRQRWAEGGQTSIAIPQTWGFWAPEDGWTTVGIGYDASIGGYVDRGTLDIQTVSLGADVSAVLRQCAGE